MFLIFAFLCFRVYKSGQNKLTPKEIKQLKFETLLKFYSSILVLFHKDSRESFHCLSTCVEFSMSTRIFASSIANN